MAFLGFKFDSVMIFLSFGREMMVVIIRVAESAYKMYWNCIFRMNAMIIDKISSILFTNEKIDPRTKSLFPLYIE